ncbi:c2H2-type domain-containing protein [Caerostris darwini]|uniref:C2H2-type domain-containing protein n=1 Tax=Caerostris darwini TaxID=1538125 RepID=A0AAV4W8M2_9ARAC|nr:c2H2-type domain-containing protein [Caerostris darwini]
MQITMFESSNDVDRQAGYILDPAITIPASLTMSTFAALHTTNRNMLKRNCVGGAPNSCLRGKGLVSATYYPIHNRHTGFHNTKYQRFKDSTRNLMKSYLLLSFPIVQIQNLIRGNVGFHGHCSSVPSKEAFISRRSIHSYYRRLQNSVRPENDAPSVMCNVERLKAEEYNPILLFKPQNSKTLYGPPGLDVLLNSEKSFALGI